MVGCANPRALQALPRRLPQALILLNQLIVALLYTFKLIPFDDELHSNFLLEGLQSFILLRFAAEFLFLFQESLFEVLKAPLCFFERISLLFQLAFKHLELVFGISVVQLVH